MDANEKAQIIGSNILSAFTGVMLLGRYIRRHLEAIYRRFHRIEAALGIRPEPTPDPSLPLEEITNSGFRFPGKKGH